MNTFMTERGLAIPEYEECFGGFPVTFNKGKQKVLSCFNLLYTPS
jgi:hypothetical protein